MNTSAQDISDLCLPPDPNPRKPTWRLPEGSWDTHFHLMAPPRALTQATGRRTSVPEATLESYLHLSNVLGFQRGMLVQGGHDPADWEVARRALEICNGRLVGMIVADQKTDIAGLRDLHRIGIRGMRIELRHMMHDFDRAWFERLTGAAGELGWAVALHLEPDSLLHFADLIPTIRANTILENYALIDGRLGAAQPAFRTLLDLAGESHVWLKAASAYRMVWKGASWDEVKPIATALHARSPDRTIWGTDWPHPGIRNEAMRPDDAFLVDFLLDVIPDPIIRRKLLVDNPRRLFEQNGSGA